MGRKSNSSINNQEQQLNLIYLQPEIPILIAFMDVLFTPIRRGQFARIQRPKRFARKPLERSQRSSSRKSIDQSVKQMYIKSPTSITKQKGKDVDFFTSLASSLMTSISHSRQMESQHKQVRTVKYSTKNSLRINEMQTDRKYSEKQSYGYIQSQQEMSNKNYKNKIKTLQAQIQLKNHELGVISGEIQRFKNQLDEQKQKRRKIEQEKKETLKELRDMMKTNQKLKMEIKRHQKQKQHTTKQIQFLERINFDEKTRTLQSYREKYLQNELQKTKKQLEQKKDEGYLQLEEHIKAMKQEKFTIQSHYKAIKVANQCLIKQLNHAQESMHDMILNSDEYKKLRDKYVRFLEEYKQLRNQYWALKAESSKKNYGYDSSSLFSISASQVESDLSLFKNSLQLSNLNISLSLGEVKNINEKGSKKFQACSSK